MARLDERGIEFGQRLMQSGERLCYRLAGSLEGSLQIRGQTTRRQRMAKGLQAMKRIENRNVVLLKPALHFGFDKSCGKPGYDRRYAAHYFFVHCAGLRKIGRFGGP